MTSNDAYNIAIKISDAAMRNLNFFIGICTVVTGWTIAGDTIKSFPEFGSMRALITFIFLVPTSGMLVGMVTLLARANAALAVSKAMFDAEVDVARPADTSLHRPVSLWISAVSMGFTIGLISLLILSFPSQP